MLLSHAPQFPCRMHGNLRPGFTSTISDGSGQALDVSTYRYGTALASSAIQMRCVKGQKELPYRVSGAGLVWRRAVWAAWPEERVWGLLMELVVVVMVVPEGSGVVLDGLGVFVLVVDFWRI